MRSGPVELGMLPPTVVELASAPFTYSRSVVPSYVPARCVHVLTGSAAVPIAFRSPPMFTCVRGRLPSLADRQSTRLNSSPLEITYALFSSNTVSLTHYSSLLHDH